VLGAKVYAQVCAQSGTETLGFRSIARQRDTHTHTHTHTCRNRAASPPPFSFFLFPLCGRRACRFDRPAAIERLPLPCPPRRNPWWAPCRFVRRGGGGRDVHRGMQTRPRLRGSKYARVIRSARGSRVGSFAQVDDDNDDEFRRTA